MIVAAGMGRRLGYKMPKCLLEIAGEALIERQVRFLKKNGIGKIVVVVGFMKELISEKLKDQVRFVINKDYANTNSLASFLLGLGYIEDDFVYMHSDLIFEEAILESTLKLKKDFCILVEKKKTIKEDMKVEVEGKFLKDIGKDLPYDRTYGEFLGISFFNKGIIPRLKQNSRELLTVDKNFYFEELLKYLSSKGEKISIVDVYKKWIEIDFVQDLEMANRMFANV